MARGKVINIAVGSPEITSKVVAGPSKLVGIYVNTTLSAHAITVQNLRTSSSPIQRTTIATIPASATAGTQYNFPEIEFDDNLILLTNSAATGSVTVIYKDKYRQP